MAIEHNTVTEEVEILGLDNIIESKLEESIAQRYKRHEFERSFQSVISSIFRIFPREPLASCKA